MKGEIFIAWGGNYELAAEVKNILEREGYIVQIGGIDNDAKNAKFFLGDEVISQIRRASRAIILAESKKPIMFRPNLTWEWGYLSGRLLPSYQHVFLIGIKRKDLFSDLAGTWCTELRQGPTKSTAKKIVKKFQSDMRQVQINPTNVLLNWGNWRQWLEDQVTGNAAPDYTLLSSVMLHSIQPAFYSGEILLLRSLIESLNLSSLLSSELPDTKRICAAACDYYIYTESGRPIITEMMQVVNSLSEKNIISTHSTTTTWLEIIRYNFLGLAYHKMSLRSKDYNRKKSYMSKSIDAFMKATGGVSDITHHESGEIVSLWKGYIHRNLGRSYEILGKNTDAKRELSYSLSERKRSIAILNSNGLANAFYMQLLLEIQSVQMDLVEYGYSKNNFALDEAVDALREFREKTGVFGIWRRALTQAEIACNKMGRKDLLRQLKALK